MASTWRNVRLQHLLPVTGHDRVNSLLRSSISESNTINMSSDDRTVRENAIGVGAFDAKGKLVGLVVGRTQKKYGYNNNGDLMNTGILYLSNATWVHADYRKRGLAKRMWAALLKKHCITHVDMTVVTDRGYTMAQALERRFHYIHFSIDESSKRLLRNLKMVAK